MREVTALLVDDDRDALDLLADALSRAGYTVEIACDGREALAILQTVRPHVIFVDLSMPIMNGAEFREAQRHDRRWLSIPTIVMTGTDEEPLLDLAVEDTLHKPIRAKELIEIVRKHA